MFIKMDRIILFLYNCFRFWIIPASQGCIFFCCVGKQKTNLTLDISNSGWALQLSISIRMFLPCIFMPTAIIQSLPIFLSFTGIPLTPFTISVLLGKVGRRAPSHHRYIYLLACTPCRSLVASSSDLPHNFFIHIGIFTT